MGTLVGKAYPTKLFLKAADHTYVECGNGAVGWSCWGGKSGGHTIVQGSGDTNQADFIAQPNERAGIIVYLVNGVCHQAANRILFPARVLVTAARGYWLSSSLFGPYGKGCAFNQYPNVTGDLSKCTTTGAAGSTPLVAGTRGVGRDNQAEDLYFKKVSELEAAIGSGVTTRAIGPQRDHADHDRALFDLQVAYRLADSASDAELAALSQAKARIDAAHEAAVNEMVGLSSATTRGLDQGTTMKGVNLLEMDTEAKVHFVERQNVLILQFQDDLANALSKERYQAFLGLDRDERLLLADPLAVAETYGAAVAHQVFQLGKE